MKIGVIDSGVHASHPHVNGVAGGIAILPHGREDADYTDFLGHGTAVTAVIREKAPAAEIFAVKIFHQSLAAGIGSLLHGIEWSVRNGMDLINLSLGTSNLDHEAALRVAVARGLKRQCRIVAAGEDAGIRWLPGVIEDVIAVELDWDCPRNVCRTHIRPDGRVIYRACGYPRPIPGVPLDRNLMGLSFAVANVTGVLAAQSHS